jgi:peptidoglycan-associated lipoprotein
MREPVLLTEPAAGLLLPLALGALGYAGMAVGVYELLSPAARSRDEKAPAVSAPRVEPRVEPRIEVAPAPVVTAPAPPPVVTAPAPPPVQAPVVPAQAATPPPRDCPPLFSVRFDAGSLRPEALPADAAARLRDWMAAHPQAILVVQGHADARGGARYNWELSYRRAHAVAQQLRLLGVPRGRISAQAAGAFQPLAGREDTAAANRRVVLGILGAPGCAAAPDGVFTEGGNP